MHSGNAQRAFVEKVNMNFYGEKQAWFLEKFPEGKVPAVEIHGKPGQKFPWMSASDVDQKLTDSDQIIAALEKAFKPLPTGSIEDMVALRPSACRAGWPSRL